MPPRPVLRILAVLLACLGLAGCDSGAAGQAVRARRPAPAAKKAAAAGNPAGVSARVSPSGNVLLLRFGSNVAGVAAGASYRVDGGPAIPLANPMWDAESRSDWAWYPLGPAIVSGVIDEGNAGYWTLAGPGWTAGNPGNSPLAGGYGVADGDEFHQTSGAADTATFTIALPAKVPYRLSVNLGGLVGPDRTARATYTASDGAGVLATFAVDQTAVPPFHRARRDDSRWSQPGLRFADLGVVTPRDGTLKLVVANGAGAGVLVCDALMVETAQPAAVPPGGAVTVDAPAGTFATAAGPVAALAALPASRETAASWPTGVAFDPAAPRTMGVGYNKALPEWGQASPFYANLFKQGSGWKGYTGTLTLDARGEIAALAGGQCHAILAAWGPNGDDQWGIKTIPRSGTFTVKCRYAGPGDPEVLFRDETGSNSFFPGAIAWGPNDPATGKRVGTCDYSMRGFAPLTASASPYYPQYTYDVGLWTGSVITEVEVYAGPPPAAGAIAHPVALDRLGGRGFATLRQLDSVHCNNSNRSEAAHYTDPADASCFWAAYGRAPIAGAAVSAIAPADPGGPEAAELARSFAASSNTGVVKVTTATPHGLVLGQRTTWSGPTLAFASTAGGDLVVNDDNAATVVPLTATTFLQEMRYPAGSWAGPGVLTVAAPHALAGTSVAVALEPSVAFEDSLRFAAECGVSPWVNVPHLFSDAACTRWATLLRDATAPGVKCRVEYSNEPWNSEFRQFWYFTLMQRRAASLHAADPARYPDDPRDPMEWHALRAAQVRDLFRAVFTAAGRGTDLIWVLNSQAGYPGYPTQSFCNVLHRRGIAPPDELTIHTYQNIGPASTDTFGPDLAACDAAFARLDDEGLNDVYDVSAALGGRGPVVFRGHRDVMAGPNTVTGAAFGSYFAGVKLTSYEGGQSVLTDRADHAYLPDRVRRAHGAGRHPRAFLGELKRLKVLQDAGCSLAVRYTLDKTNVASGPANWYDFPSIDTKAGTGDPAENRNPYDLETLVSQTGGATRFWAGTATTLAGAVVPPPPPPPPTAPALTAADLAAIAQAAWDAASPQLPAPTRPMPPGRSTWYCPALALYGDDGKGGWVKLGTAVSVYGPDGKGGWTRASTSVIPYGPDGKPVPPPP